MKRLILSLWLFVCAWIQAASEPRATIVSGEKASELERRAANELADQLQQLFDFKPTVGTSLDNGPGAAILVGSPETNPAIKAVMGEAWPKMSKQGHLLRSMKSQGRSVLVVGGNTPQATYWSVQELGYRFGIRHLLNGDFMPLEKPAFSLDGLDVVMEPNCQTRAWSAFNGTLYGEDSWSIDDQSLLFKQLARLKFTHVILPVSLPSLPPIQVDGDTPGRKAFKGAHQFAMAGSGEEFLKKIKIAAAEAGLETASELPNVLLVHLNAPNGGVLPQFDLDALKAATSSKEGFVAQAAVPGDLSASVHYLSRASFDTSLIPIKALSDLAASICGKEVDERLWKGFTAAAKAAALIAKNDPGLTVPTAQVITSHLKSAEAPPAWWTEVKTLYTEAMNEMYRANTRARDGARPYILYHAKRFEFALSFVTSIEAARKAGNAAAMKQKDAELEALDQAVETMHNALSAIGDVARDPGDQGTIAVLNEFGYRPLVKALDEASNQ